MRLQEASVNKVRVFELALAVGNVMSGRVCGIVSDKKAAEILLDLAEKHEDLVLSEHADPEIKEVMRGVRITLLPFSKRPFAS